MDLNGYFDPVSLERPDFHYLDEEYSFSRSIAIHTPDRAIKDLDNYKIALIGLPQDKGAYIKGSASAPNEVRGMLYQLRGINSSLKVYDLGNLKASEQINDSYFAIRDICLELFEREITPVFIGGSQDLSYGVFLALQKIEGIKHVLSIDPRIDFRIDLNEELNSRNYLNFILNKEVYKQFSYANIGHQIHFVPEKQVDVLEQHFMESIRLGEFRNDPKTAEPMVRDADFLSIDMNVVRHSDAPGVTIPSPNGLFGDELCVIARYGGLSEKVKVCGLFELAPEKDLNKQSSHLAAQTIWYFIDGYTHRIKENPVETPEHLTKFILNSKEIDTELVFYKSKLSERWWIEIPVKNPLTKHNYFISCSYKDYQEACNNNIPDRWWKYFHKYAKNA